MALSLRMPHKNTYMTVVTSTLDYLRNDNFNVSLRPSLRSSLHNESNAGQNCCALSILLYCK